MKAWARSKTLAKLNFLDTALLFNEMLDSEPENARCTSEESRECLWVDGFHPGERFQRAVAVEVGSVVREMVGI